MSNPKISVIVPVYNAEKYLRRCIDSILAQTFTDFELLLIDDGSKDKSGEICDEYAKKDNRIKVYHKANEGISATREYGISKANGEYIQFVDSDDWITNEMLELMYYKAMSLNADIVGCNFIEVYKDHNNVVRTYYQSSDEFVRAIISSDWGVLWKLLTKKELYIKNNIHFPIGINGGEDYFVCVKLFVFASKVISIDKALYYYNRMNESSLMNNITKTKIQYQIDATIAVEDFLNSQGLLTKYENEILKRKFYAKLPILKINPLIWKRLFPEANRFYNKCNINWKKKILCALLNYI